MSKKKEAVTIPRPNIQVMKIRVIGVSPLITHRFSAKCQKQIEDSQQHKGKQARGKRDPQQEYEDAFYCIGDPKKKKYGIPASAFKKAMVNACSHVSGITKVLARGAFYVMGDLLPITGSDPYMRTDFVRLARGGSADIRYRPAFDEWSVPLTIRYNVNAISPEQILNLLATAGFAIGVGDWRPEKDGTKGMFELDVEAAQ